MRKHRRFALGATLIAMALLAGACGSGGSASGSSVASKLVFGGPPDCPTLPFCIQGLKKVYGLTFKQFKPLDFGGPLTVAALKSGAIQIGELFSTSIYDPDFVTLQDDKHLTLADNIVPVVRTAVLNDEVTTILNAISAKLDTTTMNGLNKQVDVDKADPATVAMTFLTSNGLIPSSGSGSGKIITVGVSGGFSESKIVAEMYAEALAGAGYTTSCQCDLASRDVSDAALFGGQIDIKPEYLATEAQHLNASADVTGDPSHDSDVLSPLLQAKGVSVLNFAPAVDTNAFVVTKETASKYGLTKVSDLAKSG